MLAIRDVTREREMQQHVQQQERLAAIGQLAGGIAHDFNNLMATIILCAQMSLGKRDLSPDVTRSLETILAESRRAAKLVQQILDFSRRSMMATQPVDLVSFTEAVIDILRRTIPEHIHITLDTQGAGAEEYATPLTVEADPTRIQQALMNLALNARDAMPKGGELRIGLSRVLWKPGEPLATEMPFLSSPALAKDLLSSPLQAEGIEEEEWICLTVTDTGTGMTEEAQAHLFEPFFTTKPVGEGTGLGLAQVYGIVKQHKGYISAKTTVGEGTTFRIYLPAYEEEQETEKEKAEELFVLPRGKGEVILLVEDAERLRKAMQEILESLGYRVLTAANGQDALEVYRSAEEKVGLVITDLVMPGMGGKQLLRELRQENPDLKALAITGYVMEADLQELQEIGFLGVINKPFDVDRLAKVVRRALDEG